MNNTIAYLAGYIDGDGCFYIGKQINPIKYRNQIIISSTDKNILQFFEENFGGKCRLSNKNNRFKNYKPIYQWQLPSSKAAPLAKNLLPYLNEKKIDAEIFIKFANEKNKAIKQLLIFNMKAIRKINLIKENIIDLIKSTKRCSIITEEDFAYLSGFIDAECSLGISKYKPKNKPNFVYKITLQCQNTKSPIFYWLFKKFGGSLTFCNRKSNNTKLNNTLIWRISGRYLSKILPKILPFLQHKRPVCEKLIEFYNTILPNGGDRQSDSFKKSYSAILSKRECIVNEIHILNSRGVNHI